MSIPDDHNDSDKYHIYYL